jgi:hypothetical protein
LFGVPKGIVRPVHLAHPRRDAAWAGLRPFNFAPGEVAKPFGSKSAQGLKVSKCTALRGVLIPLDLAAAAYFGAAPKK